MKKFLLSAACCCGWLSGGAVAAPFTRTVLPNGIPLVVQESLSSPTVSLNIYIKVGSVYEKSGQTGISHFYEHMFFRGTPTRTGLEFKRAIEALGGQTNANTGQDFTHFFINMPKQYTNQGLELLADAYLNAECSQESIDGERDVVLEELHLGQNQPMRLLQEKLHSLIYTSHPYGRSVIGSEADIKATGRPELLQFKRDYYVPARTKLVITGDVDTADVQSQCKRLFGGYAAHGVPDVPPAAPPALEKDVTVTESTTIGKPEVCLAYLGPSVKERKDVYAVDVLSFMVGHGKGSLLGRELDSAKTDLDAQVSYLTQSYPGMIMLFADARAGHEQEVADKVDSVLAKVKKGDFSDKDLARARRLLTNTYKFGGETNAGKADNLGFYETIDKIDFAATYVDKVNTLKKADLVAVANKYFSQPHVRLMLTGKKAPGQ